MGKVWPSANLAFRRANGRGHLPSVARAGSSEPTGTSRMSPYRQTIRRYHGALRVPIILCVAIALWTVAGAPKQYESSVSLWVDTPPPAESWLVAQDVAHTPPADAQQLVIQELLKTRAFRLSIGHRSPLAGYLASGPSKGWSPTRLLDSIKRPAPLDAQIVAALDAKKLTATVAGPQVLQLDFTSGSPTVAAGTLKAAVAVLNEELARLTRERNKAALNFYKGQVDSASTAVTDARNAVATYERSHPLADPN